MQQVARLPKRCRDVRLYCVRQYCIARDVRLYCIARDVRLYCVRLYCIARDLRLYCVSRYARHAIAHVDSDYSTDAITRACDMMCRNAYGLGG